MGYYNHHSIIVCTYDEPYAVKARSRAVKEFGNMTTPLRQSPVNSWWSFCILPDGSKEGWAQSNMFDEARSRFSGWLIKNRYDDGSSPYYAVEVSFDDEGATSSRIIH